MFRLFILFAFFVLSAASQASDPIADASLVFAEKDGLVAVEAEHFFRQEKADVRAFHLTHADLTPDVAPDGDEPHVGGASGGAYLEILPDTRRNHGHKLIHGENFMPQPGKMAVLSYKVHINTPGRYYVWVRAHSTGSEDNGLHVGIDGEWPASGQRLQWCQGKHAWRWDSRQRTEKQHCGEPGKIFLDIDAAGEHIISFSMREDGFEFDKWLMTTDQNFKRPLDGGPESVAKTGTLPPAFKLVAAPPPPAPKAPKPQPDQISRKGSGLTMSAAMFAEAKLTNYYLDQGKWLAINPDKAKTASAARTFPFPSGKYNVVLRTVGENDGQSTYTVSVDEEKIGDYKCAPSTEMFEVGPKFHKTWKNISITEGAIIGVSSTIASADGKEFSRARWAAVAFVPADEQTRNAARPFLANQTAGTAHAASEKMQDSPTTPVSQQKLQQPRKPDGDGSVTITGELKTWHKITLNLNGPYAHEKDNDPNPFTDHRFEVTFSHTDGTKYSVPGYFAADGNAAETSAEDGTVWRAHFAPDRPGRWSWYISFVTGFNTAVGEYIEANIPEYDDKEGTLDVVASDKTGRDLRAHGRLRYVGERYLKFAGSGQYFLKVGADAPETLLGYEDFDNTEARKAKVPLKSYAAHVGDWSEGDPSWKNGKGKGLIGAINYLSGKGCNAFSFLTYNAGGDGDNVWPFIHRDDKLHYDCSKLDQWGVVFDHGTAKGMYLHFKMQETENDDHNRHKGNRGVPECLDGGNLGPQRRLYCRELIARFGHNLALNWNLGEENTQTNEQQQAMIGYIADLDAYDHNIVIHTFPNQQDKVYRALIGDKSRLTGASLQNSSLETTHAHTFKWVTESTDAGKPWVVAFDESGSAAHAQCPDIGYNGFDGHDNDGKMAYTQHKVRKQTLWGTLMAGGAGNEYYFGYKFDQNDLVCEDWRSRDQSWDYCRIAINFFHDNNIPFWEMTCADELVGNLEHKPSEFCFRKAGEIYLVYLPNGGDHSLDLSEAEGEFSVQWFNPRVGGELQTGAVKKVRGGGSVKLGEPPADSKNDWLAVLRK